jgi:hypothetical protein
MCVSDSMGENIRMLFAWMNLFAFLYILYFYMNVSLNIPNNNIIIKIKKIKMIYFIGMSLFLDVVQYSFIDEI